MLHPSWKAHILCQPLAGPVHPEPFLSVTDEGTMDVLDNIKRINGFNKELMELFLSSNRDSLNIIDLLKPQNSTLNWILLKTDHVLCSWLRIHLFPRRGANSPNILTQDLNSCNPIPISNHRKHTERTTSSSHQECCPWRDKTFVKLWDLLLCHNDCHRS